MIEIKGLTKKYGSFSALDNLNLTLEEGTVFGFVGANGAGKSTTFLILATLLQPTSGDVLINGVNVRENPSAVRKMIGYMPDFFGVYDQLKADEYLDFYGASYGIPEAERKVLIPQLLELVNLSHKRYAYVDLLSRGMKQRLCLARSLIHDPEVLILDEPASGLDPRARVEMRDILKTLKKMGKTIMISSHILPELAEMCDEIGVIDNGRLIAHGSVTEIQDQLRGERIITVRLTGTLERSSPFSRKIRSSRILKERIWKTVSPFPIKARQKTRSILLKRAILNDVPILSFMEHVTNLEDVFMEITKGAD